MGRPRIPSRPRRTPRPRRPRRALFAALALLAAVALATFASPFAAQSPDGLTRVAEEQGFAERERPHALQRSAPIEGYALPGVGDARAATALAGLSGTLLVFGVAGGAVALRRGRRPSRAPGPADPPRG